MTLLVAFRHNHTGRQLFDFFFHKFFHLCYQLVLLLNGRKLFYPISLFRVYMLQFSPLDQPSFAASLRFLVDNLQVDVSIAVISFAILSLSLIIRLYLLTYYTFFIYYYSE